MAEFLPAPWRKSMERLWDDLARTFHPSPDRREERRPSDSFWSPFFESTGPVVDLEEKDDEIVMRAEIPGLSKDDFKVEISGNRLILRGEKKNEREENREGYHYSERSFGSFARSFSLPCEVDTENVDAKYKDGVLNIHLPKTETARAKKIDIKVQ